ncbi:MAG: SufE family protein [Balneolaceae bacterium]|nr:SufE family protein [Balneolaceae bacterium]
MNIEEKQDRIVRQFELLGDWQERYKYIIKLGQKLESLDDKHKVEENLVRGCQSQVWLVTEQDDDRLIFKADSDAAITKGLVAMLVNFYSGENPDTILQTDPEFIDKIGMQQHLSPTRSNGLASMVKQMKIYAMAYKSKMGQSVQ